MRLPVAPAVAALARWMVRHPVMALSALVAVQTAFGLGRELAYPDEVRHAEVLRGVLRDGHWWALRLDGEWYPDKPPLYFWLLAGLARGLGTDGPPVHFLGVALSGWGFVLATYLMARVVGGLGREGALGAGLVLLTNYYFLERLHAPRMDLLFGSLIVVGEVGLYRAWAGAGSAAGALGLAGVSTLVKGPLGLVLPLASSAAYLGWRGRLARLRRRDVVLGAALALGLVGAWLWGCSRVAGSEFMGRLLGEQLLDRAIASPHLARSPLHYLLILPHLWLPWSAVLAVTAAGALGARWRGRPWAPAARPGSAEGGVYLWCLAITGVLVLSLISYKLHRYLLPLFAPLAVLTARHLLGLPPRGVRLAWASLATLLLAAAVIVPWARWFYPWPERFHGLWLAAALAGLGGCLVLGLGRRPIAEVVVGLALAVTASTLPLFLVTKPSLEAVTSPRGLGLVVRHWIDAGYVPVSYGVPTRRRGTLSYYAGRAIPNIDDPRELAARLAGGERLVVVALSPGPEEERPPLRGLRLVHAERLDLDQDRWVVLVPPGGARP